MNVLVTGGAGFIGSCVADRFASLGHRVTVFDSLIRLGSVENLRWLRASHGSLVQFVRGDVRDRAKVQSIIRNQRLVFHFAAQVAVTTSMVNPVEDFEVNALGSFNVVEAARRGNPEAIFIYASTNKVYGSLRQRRTLKRATGYAFRDLKYGIDEQEPVNFESPYGCSKGIGDFYFQDYARTFGLRTVVFRQSCIYGPRQFGNEDQGWVAHFTRSALSGSPIVIYGDGRQVRDLVHVKDLIWAFELATDHIDEAGGRVYNIGGGPRNAVSLFCLIQELEKVTGKTVKWSYSGWRLGDQKVYVSDTRLLARTLGWRPTIGWRKGLSDLVNWFRSSGYQRAFSAFSKSKRSR